MRFFIAAIAALATSIQANAGELTEKVDRFTGTKMVAWQSYRDPGGGYSYNAYAHYSKASDPQPYGYFTLLLAPAGTASFTACSFNDWLIDGVPAPELAGQYENKGGSQTFRAELPRKALEKIARAKSVEFKICNTEGALSASDINGVGKLLNATK